ncbi:hypothetical protein NSB25_20910 [Acetatifactor muris]|uniref:DUF302 domain-containing protein n=1 Tax=Acetatifactor muris TaxID=879566 RepID=A0A2K4ZLW1_9FIRM|nr:hypothetical protein [Acetatifactor muris]MCR2049719.1 hypothetical protein [Acetatifactor muris]SOY31477.1 hypothetical protein AMURIS_04220 [Acetatifactor muris]
MDRLAENQYKLDININQMKKVGFKFDHELEEYVYKFPVYKYNGIPLIFCKLGIDEDTKRIWFNVCDSNNILYSPYYYKEFGKNRIIPQIEKEILKVLNKLKATKVN